MCWAGGNGHKPLTLAPGDNYGLVLDVKKQQLTMQPASYTQAGTVTTGVQTFKGPKTFKGTTNDAFGYSLIATNVDDELIAEFRNDKTTLLYGPLTVKSTGTTGLTTALRIANASNIALLVINDQGAINSSGNAFLFSNEQSFALASNGSFVTGYRSSATGYYSFSANGGMAGIGGGNIASGNFSATFGRNSRAYMMGQFAHSSYGHLSGGTQHSFMQLIRDVVGDAISELFINGINSRMTFPVNNIVWVAKIYFNAVCRVSGGGTSYGDVYTAEYIVTLKNVSGVASIVDIDTSFIQSDADMSTSVVTIDTTGTSLRIQFTPPATATVTTEIRTFANIHLTEVRY